MPSGRHPLEPQAKAARRQATLENYAHKNRERLRDAARIRMQNKRRAQPLDEEARARKREVAAKYRSNNREVIRKADRQRRENAARVRAEEAQAIKPVTETTIYGVYGAQARQILGDPRATAPRRPRPATVSTKERRRKGLEIDTDSPRARLETTAEPLLSATPSPSATARHTSVHDRCPKGLEMPANLDDLCACWGGEHCVKCTCSCENARCWKNHDLK
ncbi:hypothetical protein C8F04DRAFT_1180691 [Mycena alexandri]|uniref:Uncharacterized protein n=1 Tax=Mycena alexandri TaxID=1745969 RepID=A0AAD6T1X7_9AGAR|nr:hypothetical protein C8F04DRAFT_1180691 [Mycena alexandri]